MNKDLQKLLQCADDLRDTARIVIHAGLTVDETVQDKIEKATFMEYALDIQDVFLEGAEYVQESREHTMMLYLCAKLGTLDTYDGDFALHASQVTSYEYEFSRINGKRIFEDNKHFEVYQFPIKNNELGRGWPMSYETVAFRKTDIEEIEKLMPATPEGKERPNEIRKVIRLLKDRDNINAYGIAIEEKFGEFVDKDGKTYTRKEVAENIEAEVNEREDFVFYFKQK